MSRRAPVLGVGVARIADALDGPLSAYYGITDMVTISFKVSEDEARSIRSRAHNEGVTVSEYLRRRARPAGPGTEAWRQVRCPHTGAMILAGPGGQPPLTTEAVRELLADFP